jgi:hypothetical protein
MGYETKMQAGGVNYWRSCKGDVLSVLDLSEIEESWKLIGYSSGGHAPEGWNWDSVPDHLPYCGNVLLNLFWMRSLDTRTCLYYLPLAVHFRSRAILLWPLACQPLRHTLGSHLDFPLDIFILIGCYVYNNNQWIIAIALIFKAQLKSCQLLTCSSVVSHSWVEAQTLWAP